MPKKVLVGGSAETVAEAVAAQAMWEYYKEHKALLIADIREYRDYILAQLMLGNSAEVVFGQFMRVIDAAPAVCKTRNSHKAPQFCARARAPWPFTAH